MGRLIIIVVAVSIAMMVAIELASREPITEPLRQIRGHNGILRELTFSPDGRVLATSSVDGTVKLWTVPELRLLRVLTRPAGVTSVAFSGDGQWLATGAYDGIVRLWRGDALVRSIPGHQGTVWSVDIHNDLVASGGEDNTVRISQLSTGTLVHTLRGHARNVWSVAFSPDGRFLVSGSFDRTLKLWNVGTGALVRTMTGHEQAIVGVAYGQSAIASGGDDSTVRLWRASDGALQHTLTGSDHVYSVAFSGDGQWLVSGGRERGAAGTLWKQLTGNKLRLRTRPTIRIWRVRDGALQRAVAFHTDDVWSVAVSRDGEWLASNSDDGSTALWPLDLLTKERPGVD
jgi:WD40 repeat protein